MSLNVIRLNQFANHNMFLAQRAIQGELLPERLEQFESTIGATLPDDYRDFMLENNGGVPVNRKLYLTLDNSVPEEEREWTEIECFYSIHDQPWEDSYEQRHHIPLENVLNTMRADFPDSSNYIPIAQDEYGNLIGMVLSGDTRCSVLFFDHEEGATRMLGPSFTQFCQSLLPSDDSGVG